LKTQDDDLVIQLHRILQGEEYKRKPPSERRKLEVEYWENLEVKNAEKKKKYELGGSRY
jgi:hypothetical protein